MNFREKKIAYDKLKGEQHLDADLSLLKKKAPNNEWCKKKIFHPGKAQLEILWILLDLVSKEDVVANRREAGKAKEKKKISLLVDECTSLVVKLQEAETEEEAKAILITLQEKKSVLPEDVQAEMEAIDESFLLKFEKKSEGDGEPKTEVPADLYKENLLVEENEELKEKAEELESENEELQEQVEELEEELEEEKKSQHQPKPPVKKVTASKKKKSTQTSTGKSSKGSKSSKQP